MMQACKFLDANWDPKFTVIIAQKNHHTKFFQAGGPNNIPPGVEFNKSLEQQVLCSTVQEACCLHHWMRIAVTVLRQSQLSKFLQLMQQVLPGTPHLMEVEALADPLLFLLHLHVAPVCYAHLAAAQMGTVMKFEDMSLSEGSSSHGGITTSGAVPVSPMPVLHEAVASSMFFC